MIGQIQLVNPDRGRALAAISGRLLAYVFPNTGSWELSVLEGGCHYGPGRNFLLQDFRRWTSGDLVDLDLDRWEWRVFGPWGVDRLKVGPSFPELAALASEVLRAAAAPSIPQTPLDPFEVWAVDRTSQRPLALLASAVTYFQAESIGFWPGPTGLSTNRYDHNHEIWRFCLRERHSPETLDFERRVNDRIRTPSQTGLYPFVRRIFERLEDGSAVEFIRNHRRPVPPGFLPTGQLAEPLESERIALLGRRPLAS